ncbi:MAG: hypothetical protein AB8B89_07980 [Gammaproteobacteria bacterium]
MKYFTRYFLICAFLVLFTSVSYAGHYHGYSHGSLLSKSEKIVVDAVLLRPIGLVTTVAGTAIYTVSLPFSLLGGNEPEVREHLINEPARYTFKRPLGDIDY